MFQIKLLVKNFEFVFKSSNLLRKIFRSRIMEDDSVAASSSTSMDPTTEQAENFLSFESFSKFYEVSLMAL